MIAGRVAEGDGARQRRAGVAQGSMSHRSVHISAHRQVKRLIQQWSSDSLVGGGNAARKRPRK
jgi:hypothetical protein